MILRRYIQIDEYSWEDINKLNMKLQEECLDTLSKLEKGEINGIPLGNLDDRDLTGCYKLYFNNAKHRIIYTKINDKTIKVLYVNDSTIEVLKILGVGERNHKIIYDIVYERIKEEKKD
jgi:hypothetical protein